MKIIDHDMPDSKEHEVKRVITVEMNEVHLVEQLQIFLTDAVKDMRFTKARNTADEPSEEDKSALPVVYKYYLPKPLPSKNPQPLINGRVITPDAGVYPAIVVRPSTGSSADDENSTSYSESKIDIVLWVSEHNDEDRYSFLILAKNIIFQKLRGLPGRILTMAYRLQPGLDWQLFDDEQYPVSGIVITTNWRWFIANSGSSNFENLF